MGTDVSFCSGSTGMPAGTEAAAAANMSMPATPAAHLCAGLGMEAM